jgi:hypothetical protein
MKHKVLGSVFVLAIASGMVSLSLRSPKEYSAVSTVAPTAAQKSSAKVPSATPSAPAKCPTTDRALACYKVYEHGIAGGMDYDTTTYKAQVSEQGVSFGSKQGSVRFGAPRIEQGAFSEDCAKATFSRPGFGVGSLDRGAVVEQYVFENRRMEQVFKFPAALGEGALRVRIPVTTDFPGTVVNHTPRSGNFEEIQFANGGVAFCDLQGATAISYHSAVAIDAENRRVTLVPSHQDGQIVLEVPASFMAKAAYPVLVDPWLELAGSASGGGVSGTQAVSDRPSVALAGNGNPWIAWSDNQTGNFEIYVKFWNGFEFRDLGGASFGGGLSNNAGKSVNPQIQVSEPIVFGNTSAGGVPYVVWQDDTDGRVGVFFKRWNGTTLVWEELDNSAHAGGLSSTFIGPALYPQVAVVPTWIHNVKTPGVASEPFLVWEEANEVWGAYHYPGDDQVVPGQPGWYFFQFSGPHLAAGVAGSPSVAVDSLGHLCVAWHDTASGNYEIYLRRIQDSSSAATQVFYSVNPFAGVQNINPNTGVFNGLTLTGVPAGVSDAGGGISNTPTQLSQYPSLAADGNAMVVAWQETTPGGTTGTNNEIYVARSVGGGGWTGLGAPASNTGGGVSQTAGDSFTPSVDSVKGAIVVAWSDDTSGNPEIYLRRFFVGSSTQWEQVGVQGSAFPLLGADTIAPPGGVSNTPNNLSMTPQVKVDGFGNPAVIWADGAQGSLDIYFRQFFSNGPGVMDANLNFITDLRQTLTDPVIDPAAVDLTVGQATAQTTVFLSAHVFEEPPITATTTVRLQVEVQEQSAPFTGTPTKESYTAPPGSLVSIAYSGLPNRNYKWQIRTVDQIGRTSPYVQMPTLGGASFAISSSVPTAGPPNTTPLVSTTRSKGHCGLLGLEALGVLGLLRVLRRRRSK